MKRIQRIINATLGKISPSVAEHAIGLLLELYIAMVHFWGARKCSSWASGKRDLRVNIGCGIHKKKDYVNLDFVPDADFRLDLRKPLPLPDGSCQELFSEHFVEHLSYPEGVEDFFNECFRVLRPQGLLRLSVPDTTWPLSTFQAEPNDWLEMAKARNWHPKFCTTYMEHLNYHFRQRGRNMRYSHFENHRFAWDYSTMEKKLQEAGFTCVAERTFDPDIDSEHRKHGSLFVRALRETSRGNT